MFLAHTAPCDAMAVEASQDQTRDRKVGARRKSAVDQSRQSSTVENLYWPVTNDRRHAVPRRNSINRHRSAASHPPSPKHEGTIDPGKVAVGPGMHAQCRAHGQGRKESDNLPRVSQRFVTVLLCQTVVLGGRILRGHNGQPRATLRVSEDPGIAPSGVIEPCYKGPTCSKERAPF